MQMKSIHIRNIYKIAALNVIDDLVSRGLLSTLPLATRLDVCVLLALITITCVLVHQHKIKPATGRFKNICNI